MRIPSRKGRSFALPKEMTRIGGLPLSATDRSEICKLLTGFPSSSPTKNVIVTACGSLAGDPEEETCTAPIDIGTIANVDRSQTALLALIPEI